MAERSGYAHGEINWVDLCTDDTGAARAFYSEMFGWAFEDQVDEESGESVYYLALKAGKPVAGLMSKPQELVEMGHPNFWETYVMVDDVEAARAAAAPAGGTPMGPVMDASGAGRLAVVGDPANAVLILWEPEGHFGAHLLAEPGAVCWHELVSTDVDAAMGFYSKLLGWTAAPMGTAELVGIRCGDDFIASASPAPEGVPSHWSVYFAVQDCDAAVARCLELGGKVAVPASDQAPGRMAMLLDDCGAAFWVIAINEQFSMTPA